MGNKEKFIQLSNICLPTPCITPGGIVSDNKISLPYYGGKIHFLQVTTTLYEVVRNAVIQIEHNM